MAHLYLVRHGRAAAGWNEDTDPDLHEDGRAQAIAVAVELAELGPLAIVTSPLRRARSTAAAFERIWGVPAVVEPRVGEIPSPSGQEGELERRGPWLARIMGSTWDAPDLDAALRRWRDEVVEALLAVPDDAVVATHFVAINVAFGAATGDSRVTCFRPDYCSFTVFENDSGRLELVQRGREGATVVR